MVPAERPARARLAGAPRTGARYGRAAVRALGGLLRLLHPAASAQAFREVAGMLLRNRTLTI